VFNQPNERANVTDANQMAIIAELAATYR